MELMQDQAQSGLICVQTTVSRKADAKALARALITSRLAACVQLSAIQSLYRWKDEVDEEGEVLLTIKTLASALPAIEALIQAEHPYDEPELIALPMLAASEGYAAWVRENVG